jgi:hypothetical protein
MKNAQSPAERGKASERKSEVPGEIGRDAQPGDRAPRKPNNETSGESRSAVSAERKSEPSASRDPASTNDAKGTEGNPAPRSDSGSSDKSGETPRRSSRPKSRVKKGETSPGSSSGSAGSGNTTGDRSPDDRVSTIERSTKPATDPAPSANAEKPSQPVKPIDLQSMGKPETIRNSPKAENNASSDVLRASQKAPASAESKESQEKKPVLSPNPNDHSAEGAGKQAVPTTESKPVVSATKAEAVKPKTTEISPTASTAQPAKNAAPPQQPVIGEKE